jgi:hypothetical protein
LNSPRHLSLRLPPKNNHRYLLPVTITN